MNIPILTFTLIAVSSIALLSGCATNHDSTQDTTTRTAEQNSGPTVSGYISTGGEKHF